MTEGLHLPREMVLASAGSGKTYHLSSRLIGLLARGVSPETIWASTFTRKAAAEILERVLLRLARGALDDAVAKEVARSAWMDKGAPIPDGFLDSSECARLLAGLVRALHRANVGTLDAFFVQVATTFAEDLGLPPGWTLVEGPSEDRLRSEALEAVLGEGDPGVMAELVRIITRGEVRRGVQRPLLEQVEQLLHLHRVGGPESEELWTPLLTGVSLAGAPTEREVEDRCAKVAAGLAEAPVPPTKIGTPNQTWTKALTPTADKIRTRDWDGFFGGGPGKKLVDTGVLLPATDIKFGSAAPGPELAAYLDEAAALARIDLGRQVIRQGQALGRMATLYREAFERTQLAAGGFRFGDVTHALRHAGLFQDTDSLYFRLDARIRHLLLDEFQDTSMAQWDVLAPLAEELLSGDAEERAAVVVADPKQSIYGWRGAQPALVDRIRVGFGLNAERLPHSYRSGPVILGSVARVFEELHTHPVVQALGGGEDVAGRWVRDFYPQTASDPDQPGFVRLLAGPEAEGTGGLQPAVLDFSAEMVGALHTENPRASIGVLVRKNRIVQYLISALRRRGIPASGEGGTALTDTAPVNGLLALFRMADHPGSRLARYHVATTPVGEIVGFTNHEAGADAKRLARRIRGRLLRDGYGAVLDGWVRALEPSCDMLERARLHQLVELGFRWDSQRTLRPSDFVWYVENQNVEDPSGALIRVMTIHKAKGLQFDEVVLPHLHEPIEGRGFPASVEPLWDEQGARLLRVYPATRSETRALFPELRAAHAQARAHGLRDELSALYVAMTRARFALHMVVPAYGEGGPGTTKSGARLLREALAEDPDAPEPGVLYEVGDPEWWIGLDPERLRGGAAGGEPDTRVDTDPPEVQLQTASGSRTRNLARQSPSSLEGGEVVDLARYLDLEALTGEGRREALRRGTVVHAWCEEVGWVEEGLPSDEVLREVAYRHAPGLSFDRLTEWLGDFRGWMEDPEVRRALSRDRYPQGAEIEQELPFLHRTADGILQGYVDRLVLWRDGGRVVGAEVLDFKTDFLDAADPGAVAVKMEYYRPQLDAYREAVGGRYGLDPAQVSGTLLFLRPGLVRTL